MFLSGIGFSRLRFRNTITIGAAIAIATVGVVRAERLMPDLSEIFKCSTGTACVTGKSTGASTWGVYGTSVNADGVHGITDSSANSGVAGFANNASGGHGVFGSSKAGDGVHGQTYTTTGNSGVAGLASGTSGNGYGVYGNSSNGIGVYGTSSAANNSGVFGTSSAANGTGVTGNSNSFNGVFGSTNATYNESGVAGVLGEAANEDVPGVLGAAPKGTNAIGVEATANDQTEPALYAFTEGTGTYIASFQNLSSGIGLSCLINAQTDLHCDGTITSGLDVRIQHRNSAGRAVVAYASESATPTIEDLGVAQLHEGIARVELPGDFSSVMSHQDAYYVFLTPMGESRGLYVSMQTAAGFEVRENERGRSNVEFQFRIVAVPNGARNVRLPAAPRIPDLTPRDLRH
jgi:hypothetical protein